MTFPWIVRVLMSLLLLTAASAASALQGYGDCAPGQSLIAGAWGDNKTTSPQSADGKSGFLSTLMIVDQKTQTGLDIAILNDSNLVVDFATQKVYAEFQNRRLEIGIVDPAVKASWLKPATSMVRPILCKTGVEFRLEDNGKVARQISKGGAWGRRDETFYAPGFKAIFTDRAHSASLGLNYYGLHKGAVSPGY